MILACPFCQSRFLVPASLFASGERQVQCARCRHSWRAEMADIPETQTTPANVPPEMFAAVTVPRRPLVTILDIKNKLETIRAFVSGCFKRWKALTPKHRRLTKNGALCLGLILAVLFFIFGRDVIASRWPGMERVYSALHLYVNHYHGGEGLVFEHMRSDLRYEGGQMQLTVEGEIRNKSKEVQEIPQLLAAAVGADGAVIESWQIDAPAANVAPGEEVPFTSSINAPRSTAVNVNVSFIEKKNE